MAVAAGDKAIPALNHNSRKADSSVANFSKKGERHDVMCTVQQASAVVTKHASECNILFWRAVPRLFWVWYGYRECPVFLAATMPSRWCFIVSSHIVRQAVFAAT